MAGPKVAVIGAGSFFFGKCVIHKLATSPVFRGGTLALVDTDPGVLRTMTALAKRVFKHCKADVRVVGSTNHRKILDGADFVVLTYSFRNTHYRGVDTEIAARHGILMCSSDTIGPGGIFRAMRELPVAMKIAEDVRRQAPDAWLINFVNPTSVMGIGLRRYAPFVRSFALCDGHHEPYNTLNWCKTVGILPQKATDVSPEVWQKLDLAIGGVNHCTWIVRFRYAGRDYMPKLYEWVAAQAEKEKKDPHEHSKARYNMTYAQQLFDLYGAYPTAMGHTKEYVPFWQGYGMKPNRPEPIRLFNAEERQKIMDETWAKTEAYANGKAPMSEFMKLIHNDHATDIIESMWGNLKKPFYINNFNNGSITNMPADAFVELRSDLDMRGPRPQPFGSMPRGLLALQMQVLDTHELTAQAAVTGDRAILRRAMLTDPICNNIDDADGCIRDLLEAERDVLPKYWYR